jgi:prepilin-type N-terminal cleavage/methylation domain-containing protein
MSPNVTSAEDLPSSLGPAAPVRRGFTLVEMMVVTVLIAVLASLSLAGLAVARGRAKADKTRSTLRKLNEIIVPHYESYLNRRVPFVTTAKTRTNAVNRLVAIRTLMVREMPDTWADVRTSVLAVTGTVGGLPAFLRTGPVMAYAATRAALGAGVADAEGSAECLYMIVSRGSLEPDLMEQFRTDEIGDTDRDGAPEFLDGWADAIAFLRWAPGFSSSPGTPGTRSAPLTPIGNRYSPIQFADPQAFHDPFDPQRVDANGYTLTPLLISGGPDMRPGMAGLQPTDPGWSGLALQSIVSGTYGAALNAIDFRDNITNHDLITR